MLYRHSLWRVLVAIAFLPAMVPLASGVRVAHAAGASIIADGSTCTLIQAITDANNGTSGGGCTLTGSGTPITIFLQSNTTLTSGPFSSSTTTGADGLPVITSNIIIQGSDKVTPTILVNRTIKRNSTTAFRFFEVAANGGLELEDLTLDGGSASVDTTDTLFNYGGAILASASSSIVSLFQDTLINNNAQFEGGTIASLGTLNILDTTILTSTVPAAAGSVYVADPTAGAGAFLNMANSTIADNSAGSGIHLFHVSGNGVVGNITNSTFFNAGSAAAIDSNSNSNTVNLYNSILTGSPGCIGTVIDGGHNLVDDASCTGSATKANGLDTTTGVTNNGGPTPTLALVEPSNAIDQVPAGACKFHSAGTNPLFSDAATIGNDQRGLSRPIGTACDIGAFEAFLFSPTSSPPGSTVLPADTIGADYSLKNVTISVTAPASTYTFAVASGTLPPGLSLNPTTGVLSGHPTTTQGSPFTFTVSATDTVSTMVGKHAYSLAITPAGTTTAAQPAIAVFGQPSVSLSATVKCASPCDATAVTVNEGQVTFTVTGIAGSATCAVSGGLAGGLSGCSFALPAGTAVANYTINAAYTDTGPTAGPNFTGTAAATTSTLTVGPAGTTTAAQPANAVFGQTSVSLSATVKCASPCDATAVTVNEGHVTFIVTGIAGSATCAVSGGLAGGPSGCSFTLPFATPAGSYPINATYTDDTGANFQGSNNSTQPPPNLTINGAPTITSANTPNAVTYSAASQHVTLSATVTCSSPCNPALTTIGEGHVTFTVMGPGGQIGPAVTCPVSGGAAATGSAGCVSTDASPTIFYTLPGGIAPSPPAGPYTVNATYTDDTGANFQGSNNSKQPPPNLTVLQAPTTTSANTPNPVTFSAAPQQVTLSATVKCSSPCDAANTTVGEGHVTFTITGVAGSATCAVINGLAGGVAGCPFTLPGNTAAGSYTINATYTDDTGPNFKGSNNSTQPPPALTVNKASTTTTTTVVTAIGVIGQPNPVGIGQSVTYLATVKCLSPCDPTVTKVTGGSVTFYDGAVNPANLITSCSGQALNASSQATCVVSYTASAVGVHQIFAVYSGSANFLPSTASQPWPETVYGCVLTGVLATGGQRLGLAVSSSQAFPFHYLTLQSGPTILLVRNPVITYCVILGITANVTITGTAPNGNGLQDNITATLQQVPLLRALMPGTVTVMDTTTNKQYTLMPPYRTSSLILGKV